MKKYKNEHENEIHSQEKKWDNMVHSQEKK